MIGDVGCGLIVHQEGAEYGENIDYTRKSPEDRFSTYICFFMWGCDPAMKR